MFSIIGVEGIGFRGTLEELLETRPVDPAWPSERLRRVRPDAADEGAARHDHEQQAAAAAAYARMERPVERGAIYRAAQVMSRDVFVLAAGATATEAWRALAGRRIGQAPVVDAAQHLIGLVTRENLLHVLNEEHGRVRDVLARTVGDVMVTPVVSADPGSDVRRVARVMLEYRLPAVPVVDDAGRLVGIVSQGDILRAVVSDPPLTLWG